MGKQSRRKQRTRDQQASEQPTPRQAFQMAMMATQMEEIRDHGHPCILCGETTHNAGFWAPIASLSRYLGGPPDKQRMIVYALCNQCYTHPDRSERIELEILNNHRTRVAAREAGLEIVDGMIALDSPEAMRRFSEAFERNAPPIY